MRLVTLEQVVNVQMPPLEKTVVKLYNNVKDIILNGKQNKYFVGAGPCTCPFFVKHPDEHVALFMNLKMYAKIFKLRSNRRRRTLKLFN